MDNIKEFEKIKETIKNGEILKVRAEERLSYLKKVYNEKVNQIKNLGYDPKNLKNEIEKEEKEIEEKIKKINEILPTDLIEKYKNCDFSAEVKEVKNEKKEESETPDLNKDF